jgi:hypothetical protein
VTTTFLFRVPADILYQVFDIKYSANKSLPMYSLPGFICRVLPLAKSSLSVFSASLGKVADSGSG